MTKLSHDYHLKQGVTKGPPVVALFTPKGKLHSLHFPPAFMPGEFVTMAMDTLASLDQQWQDFLDELREK